MRQSEEGGVGRAVREMDTEDNTMLSSVVSYESLECIAVLFCEGRPEHVNTVL